MSFVFILELLNLTAPARDVSQPSTLGANFVTDYMLQYDRQMQSPIIEPYVKQYTLDKGTGSVPFRCVSSSPISWYREENSPWTSTVQATCSSTSNQSNGSHCASIAFTNASIEQVGRYYCAKDAEVRQYREQYGWTNDETLRLHLADLEAEFHATSFYLFVDDPEQPLVPGNSIISIGHVLHVPCKPTTPRAEVDLINMDGNPVTGVYSSTDGVIISSGPYSYHNRFFCRDHFAKQHEVIFKNRSDDFEDKPHFSSIDKYAITFETEVKKGYLYPLLDLDFKVTAAYNVIPSGAWVHLVCGSGFGRQKLSIIPAAAIVEKVNKTLQRVLSTVTKSPITRMEQAAIKELVIESATVEHSGTYRCETPTLSHTNVTYFSSVKLYVLNSTEDFIYFSEGNTNATSIRVPKEFRTDGHSKPVTIAINYEYYAAEVNCSWFRDGMPTEALCGNCSERYEIQHKWRRDSLTILHPTIWESGRYTVECRVGNGIRRNTSRDVFIEGDWEVAMSPKRVEMVSSSPVELVCRSRGVDNPTFQLYFIECDYQTWDKCRDIDDKEPLETMNNSKHRTAFEVYHAFVITPKEFGIVVCDVLSEHGTRRTETILQNPESEAKAILNGKIITTVLVITALGVLLFVGIVWGYRKYTEGKVKLSKDGTESMDGADTDRVDFLPDVYKIPREQVQLCERLGQGEFGITWMAKVSGMSEDPSLETVVAVKEPKERNDRQMLVMLVSELKVHVHAGHHLNVVNLLGAVVENISEGELLLVMEYCRFGDMKHFLQQNRPYFENNADDGLFGSAAPDSTSTSSAVGYPFSTTDLLYWASQIACGMDYLGTSGLIHGDLAARNVLLCEGSIVKIGDFGMARITRRDDVYRKSDSNARLPLAWMAVESLRDRIFSSSSDVWAYGVLLWELFTLGTEPYSTLLVNETILDLLTQGYRMQKPEYASTDVYSVMRNCWEEDPCARPTFKDLFTEFNNRLPNRLRKQYARLNEPYVYMNALERKVGSQKAPLHVYVNESIWSSQNASNAEKTMAVVIKKPKMQLPMEQTVEEISQITVVDSCSEINDQQCL